MKKNLTLCLLVTLISYSNALAQFQFVSPLPGSVNLPPQHNIILREGHLLQRASLNNGLFSIRGTQSGQHNFNLVLCDDGKTINLNPVTPFGFNEVVTVTVQSGLSTVEGKVIDGFTFSFTTHREWTAGEQEKMKQLKSVLLAEEIRKWDHSSTYEDTRGIDGMFTINTNNNPADGVIFFDSWSGNFVQNKFTGYSAVRNNGDSVYFRKLNYGPNDFQMGKNGLFETFRSDLGRYDVLDSNFIVVDNYYALNGYYTNNHELQMEANGNAWLIADEYQTVDMTVYKPNYSPNATVLGNVIQKLDPSHNLLFEWRGFDHVTFNEAQYENLAYSFIDYMHTNAIEVDNDGNILISSRHLDQIDKINVNTGDFIWRLGGLHNEFTFPNNPARFSYQHDIRRLANGNVTLYDDGNFHSPAKSFAKEYQLDEVNKVATLVWSYSLPDINGSPAFYFAMGSTQRLSNGNTLIGWGWRGQSGAPSFTEVTPGGAKAWELTLADGGKNIVSYRVHKYLWTPCARPTFSKLKNKNITATSAKLQWSAVANETQQYEVQYKKDADAVWIDKKVSPSTLALTLTGLASTTKYNWRIQSRCDTVANIVSNYTAVKNFTTHAIRGTALIDNALAGVQIYPNPAHDVITIQSDEDILQVRMMNLLGQEVRNLQVNDQQVQMFVSDLAHGNYFVEVTSNESKRVMKIAVE